MVRSREAETICRLSAEKETLLSKCEFRTTGYPDSPYSQAQYDVIARGGYEFGTKNGITYERTSPVCPTNFLVVKPVFKSQSLKVLSHDEDRANCPSEEMAMSETKWL